MTKKALYRVMYWDAYGDAHVTEPMEKGKAETMAKSMLPHQDARTVLVFA